MTKHWHFMSRYDICSPEGELYLRRWRIIQTPWFAIYLHKIMTPDKDRDLHDHPWPFLSLILRGGYDEMVHDHPAEEALAGYRPIGGVERCRWFSVKRATAAHRIVRLHRTPTWTLVLAGRRCRSWGFYTERGFVDWREYLGVSE